MSDDSMWPEPPKEQVEAEQRQESRITASLPVIQDVLDWYDSRIAHYLDPLTLENIGTNSPAEDVKQAVLFAHTVVIDYKTQKANFEAQFSKYIEEPADEA